MTDATIKDSVLQVLENRRSEWLATRVAVLGDLEGNVATGVPYINWARVDKGIPFKVLNRVAPEVKDTKVRIGKSIHKPTIWQVMLQRDTPSQPQQQIRDAHHIQHEWPNFDTVFNNRKQITALTILVSDALNFKVQVYGDVIHTATGIHLLASQEINISASVPLAGARYITFQVNDSAVVTVLDGAVLGSKELLTDADIPVPETGKYFLGYALLVEGMIMMLDDYIRVPLSLNTLVTGMSFQIHEAPEITTLQSADEFGVWNSLTEEIAKITWDNLQAALSPSVWGSITGTLSDQTDLQTALDDKADVAYVDSQDTAILSAAESYADGLVVGLWDDRGSFDASSGAYPSSGGSGSGGAVLKGDIWTISVAGTLPTSQVVEVGDVVRALIDTPGNTQANWAIQQNNIGYTAENSANKATTMTGNETSNIIYLTAKAIYDWAVAAFAPIAKGVTNGDSHDHDGGDGGGISTAMGTAINTATSKNPPVGADSVGGYDSVGGSFVRFTMTNIRTFCKTLFDSTYAAIANGVTNGDLHDHNGGDGGTIAYASLSGKPIAETNTDDIFLVSAPGGVSAFAGTINGTPSGTSVTYNVTSGQEGAMVPFATTQLAKVRLYNTTRGNSALISNCNTTTNVITLTANAPANWANGDTITIASQTTSGGGFSWVDLEITSGPTSKSYLFVKTQITSATPGDSLRIHPFTASFSASKLDNLFAQVANQSMPGFALIVITGNVFSIAWTGSPTSCVIREAGYLE